MLSEFIILPTNIQFASNKSTNGNLDLLCVFTERVKQYAERGGKKKCICFGFIPGYKLQETDREKAGFICSCQLQRTSDCQLILY